MLAVDGFECIQYTIGEVYFIPTLTRRALNTIIPHAVRAGYTTLIIQYTYVEYIGGTASAIGEFCGQTGGTCFGIKLLEYREGMLFDFCGGV